MEDVSTFFKEIRGETVGRIGRAGNMMWLEIGPVCRVTNFRGDEVEKSKYALHVQAPWRIVNENEKIIFAFSDFYMPRGKVEWTEDFEWDVQGANLFDEKAESWLKEVEEACIKKIEMDSLGDLKISFSNGDRLEIFIDSSTDIESWRLFKSDSNKKHLVVSAMGMEFD